MSQQQTINRETEPAKSEPLSSETIFKYVNLVVTLILVFCIQGFLNFREHCQAKGFYVLSMDSLVWSLVGFVGIFTVKYSWFYFFEGGIESIVHPKYQGEQRVHKTRSLLKLSFDAVFYSCVTIFAYTLFRKEYWFPSMAGGCGSCSQIYKEYPSWPVDSRAHLEMYFMIQLGIHFFSLFEVAVLKRKTERKFYQFVLHHSVAVSLILFSTMSNQIAAGTMILIVHDASDIMMAFVRFYVDIKYSHKWFSIYCYLLMLFSWIWMRIVVFPFCLLAQVYANKPTPSDMWNMISFEYGYLLSMAFVLEGMHVFWTFFILKAGVKKLSSKSQNFENTHDKKIKK